MEVRFFPAISSSVLERRLMERKPASINTIAKMNCGMRKEKLRVISCLFFVGNMLYDTLFYRLSLYILNFLVQNSGRIVNIQFRYACQTCIRHSVIRLVEAV